MSASALPGLTRIRGPPHVETRFVLFSARWHCCLATCLPSLYNTLFKCAAWLLNLHLLLLTSPSKIHGTSQAPPSLCEAAFSRERPQANMHRALRVPHLVPLALPFRQAMDLQLHELDPAKTGSRLYWGGRRERRYTPDVWPCWTQWSPRGAQRGLMTPS